MAKFDFEDLKKQLSSQTNKVKYERDKKLRALEHKKSTEIRKIERKYKPRTQQQEKQAEEETAKIEEDYLRGAGADLLSEFDKQYDLLQKRNELLGIPEEQVEAARELIEIIEEQGEKRFLDTQAYLGSVNRDFKEVREMLRKRLEEARKMVSIADKVGFNKEDIVSYLTYSHDSCDLFVPVKGGEKKQLARNLEDKIDKILDQRAISIEKTKEINIDGSASANSEKISFEASPGLLHEFLLYDITPNHGVDGYMLAKLLKSKLEELQPNGFEETNLVHKVEIGDERIINYLDEHHRYHFADLSKQRAYRFLSRAEAAKILGKSGQFVWANIRYGKLKETKEGISYDAVEAFAESRRIKIRDLEKKPAKRTSYELDYEAREPGEMQKEAYARLAIYETRGKNMGIKEASRVLGRSKVPKHNNYVYIDGLVKKGYLDRAGRGKIKADSLRQFLETHYIDNNLWKKK